MARRIGIALFMAVATLVATHLCEAPLALAQGSEMDAQGEALAKNALHLYKQGHYQEAAEIFAKLSVDYPDMLVFERNLGACYYYLRKPEPALSNLRHYLSHKGDVEPDDKATVERWINEMEKLREQNTAAPPAHLPTEMAPGAAPPPSLPAPEGPRAMPPAAPVPPSEPVVPPAALDVTTGPTPATVEPSSPFYAKWWFWGTVGILAAGTVTTYLIVSRGKTENACSGGSLPCDAIK